MTKNELAEALRINLYGDRGTDLGAAYQYVNMIHDALPSDHRPAVGTALHVLVNTIANCILDLPDALPATPETVTLSRADDPSRGSWSEYDLLMLINKTIESWFDDNVDIDHAVEEYIENSVDFTEIVRDELRGTLTLTVTVE
jgi:hypothetical protein